MLERGRTDLVDDQGRYAGSMWWVRWLCERCGMPAQQEYTPDPDFD